MVQDCTTCNLAYVALGEEVNTAGLINEMCPAAGEEDR